MITSTNNNQIKNIIALNKKARERRAQRLFVVEGIRAVAEVPGDLLHAIYYIEGFGDSADGKDFRSHFRKASAYYYPGVIAGSWQHGHYCPHS